MFGLLWNIIAPFMIWSPSSVGDIGSVERVQRRFTKRLPGLNKSSSADKIPERDVQTYHLLCLLITAELRQTCRPTSRIFLSRLSGSDEQNVAR